MLIPRSQLSNRAAQAAQSLAGVWQQSLCPCSPAQSSDILLDPPGTRPWSPTLWTLAGIALKTSSCFHPDFLVHKEKEYASVGMWHSRPLTWLGVSSGTEQQEKNEGVRCRNFFSLSFM